MQLYKKLSVWRKAHELALRVFRATAPLYAIRQSYLAGQMRRAASSIPANIAEGTGRSTSAQFAQFLQQALGSARELDYHLLLARDLELIAPGDHAMLEARVDEVTKMLVALRRTVANRPPPSKATKPRPRPSPLSPPAR
ncbi:MAG: four helix bundle protein [Gemmatimonadaceae bacterium]|nr:four helix bundle protein [Gemmatimonadaceae bacterium]